MLEVIRKNAAQIEAICRLHCVKQLDVFGSATRDDFDPEKSDIDFFVEFQDYTSPKIADQWFGLIESLEALLGRKVDLVTISAVKNPLFLEVANESRVSLYAA